MHFAIQFFNSLVSLSNAMSIYILFGLLFAGVLHEFIPDSIVSKHLGKSSIASVIKATIFGIPLPVCSCGVIPLATNIKKSGASNGSTLAFLISTPVTGIDSMLATYGIFGWVFTIYRIISSVIISLVAGVLTNMYQEKSENQPLKPSYSLNTQNKNIKLSNFSVSKTSQISTCQSSCLQARVTKKSKIKNILNYSFSTLLKDIASPLLVGLLLGALITTVMPTDLSHILIRYNWLSYIIAVAVAVPLYVCATASLPIAAGLMLAGVSPGAAFVFLSAGPATNTVTIGIVKKMFGTKTLYIYLATIIIGSVLFGIGLDYMFGGINVEKIVHINEHVNMLQWLASIVLWSLISFYVLKSHLFKNKML